MYYGFSVVKIFLYTIVLGVIVAIGLYFVAPSMMRRYPEQAIAIQHGKQIAMALEEFRTEYGSYPDQDTAIIVKQKSQSLLELNGNYSNGYFRQLILSGIIEDSEIFHAYSKHVDAKRPAKISEISNLESGEVDFGYIMNGDIGLDKAYPRQVVLVTPLLNSSINGEFDIAAMGGMAVLIYLDGSAMVTGIFKDHKVRITCDAQTLLETGKGTIWGTKVKPVIKPPKPN